MNHDLKGALEAYLVLLEKEAYFDAHEVLEEAWHPLRLQKDPLAHLLKGLINAAITFEHIKRAKKNTKDKAQRVIASYERYKHLATAETLHYSLFTKAIVEIETLKIRHKEIFDKN
jgi:hypothetical protein